MNKDKFSSKREARMVELVALLEAQEYVMLPTDASKWAKQFGVSGQVIRADIRWLRSQGYLPRQSLAVIKQRFKPKFVGKGVM